MLALFFHCCTVLLASTYIINRRKPLKRQMDNAMCHFWGVGLVGLWIEFAFFGRSSHHTLRHGTIKALKLYENTQSRLHMMLSFVSALSYLPSEEAPTK